MAIAVSPSKVPPSFTAPPLPCRRRLEGASRDLRKVRPQMGLAARRDPEELPPLPFAVLERRAEAQEARTADAADRRRRASRDRSNQSAGRGGDAGRRACRVAPNENHPRRRDARCWRVEAAGARESRLGCHGTGEAARARLAASTRFRRGAALTWGGAGCRLVAHSRETARGVAEVEDREKPNRFARSHSARRHIGRRLLPGWGRAFSWE